MKVLAHHIYEYKKGIRPLILHTLDSAFQLKAELKLKQQGIDYVVQTISPSKINIFFGDEECVNTIREIGDKKLNEYTPEEDFILGIMLGYDCSKQCKRYLQYKKQERNVLFKYIGKRA